VAEQLGVEKIPRDRGAVLGRVATVGAQAGGVDRPRQQLLAGPRLAED
jgi:hypothetical protein